MTDRRGQERISTAKLPPRPTRPPAPPPPSNGWQGNEPPPAPREPGPVELGLETDLRDFGPLPRGRAALTAAARKLARTIDARGDDEPASALAKAVDTLRQTMAQIMAREASNPNDLGELGRVLGTPDAGSPSVSPALRYPPEPGPSNGRSSNRRGRPRTRSE